MANIMSDEKAAPTRLPPRRFHGDLSTVKRLASVFGGDEAKVSTEANMKSQLEWDMDMEWLEEMSERWALTASQRAELENKFRARHREHWGDYAYQGD